MATTPNVIIDPMTRIEGHLRIQAYAEPDGQGGGVITKPGLSSSTMIRGIESILLGRDPRDAWAFTQRICGVCTVVHGLTSVRAVEHAIGIKVPKNADYIRNMMIGAQYVHDHVMHFYHLHALDWVDVVSALEASPAAVASLARSNNPGHKPDQGRLPDAAYFQTLLNKLNGMVSRGQLGLFANGYWGHPGYKLSPEANLLLVSHYLEALGWAREVVKLHAVFGGKDPHPNLVVGGMPCTLSSNPGRITEDAGGTSLNTAGLAVIKTAIATMKSFVDQVYLPDVRLLASQYREWAMIGATEGHFLCFGDFPDPALVRTEFKDGAIDYPAGYLIPPGVIWAGDPTRLRPFDPYLVTENVAHAWYQGSTAGEHPAVGSTTLHYTGPKPDGASRYMLDESQRYSWIKSPRYDGEPMEVGPLAHILAMHARGTLPTDKLVRRAVQQYWTNPVAQDGLGLTIGQLNSTLGRIFCRMLETKIIADQMADWYQHYFRNRSGAYWNPETFTRLTQPQQWPQSVGFGFTEAPRGALGHWVRLDRASGLIANYQCVVASQWNAGPRDGQDTAGPYERALVGHRLVDVKRPLEVLRTIHSFDPCIGCAVHLIDPDGQPLIEVDVNHAARVSMVPDAGGTARSDAHPSSGGT
ncbi:nickel-dependent hydrogenase large subunit [uncultured Lamprocystis sp.]|jgi:hydrogenase large subunit|uniref:nickel-dependent hydrogenase large subunit n=1 Tax=uncultured Lamprocystis sp. TaxID=543132 RepID=UPI0025CCB479|nr:nickel-dependent hydrogenase large subunit [uncultured Lamprocystis sp.]